jgi:hypothetical protein
MSKERARRRVVREREAAIRVAARASRAERAERRQARRRALGRVADRLSPGQPVGRPTGALARRRRLQLSMLGAVLVAANMLVWVVRPDWPARVAALIVTILAAPVLVTLVLPRRR